MTNGAMMRKIIFIVLLLPALMFSQFAKKSFLFRYVKKGTTLNGTNQTWQDAVPTGLSFERTTPFSVVMYLRVNAVVSTSDNFISVRKTDASATGWAVQYAATNKIMAVMANNTSATTNITGTTTNNNVFTTGQFFVLVMTYDGSSLNTGFKIYVNGTSLAVTGASTLSATTVTNASFCIGSRDNTDRWANITVGMVQVISGVAISQSDVSRIQAAVQGNALPSFYSGGTIIASYNWRNGGVDISGTGNILAGINGPRIVDLK